MLYLEKLAGEDERANNKKSHVARGMKEKIVFFLTFRLPASSEGKELFSL